MRILQFVSILLAISLIAAAQDSLLVQETTALRKAAIAYEKKFQFDSAIPLHYKIKNIVAKSLRDSGKRDSALAKVYIDLNLLDTSRSENKIALHYHKYVRMLEHKQVMKEADMLKQSKRLNIGKNYINHESWQLAKKYHLKAASIETTNQRADAI
ncbi:MAG: hypothetical protein AAF789_00780 [Bacteroidota bacterium]